MQINSCSFWLFLAFTITLVNARYYVDDDSKQNDERRQIYFYPLSPLMLKKLYIIMANEQLDPYEQDRLSPVARRAKAIVKGDPREFMG